MANIPVDFQQGEELKLRIPVLSNGSPVDLTACNDIIVRLDVNGTVQYTYSKVAVPGNGTLAVSATVGEEHIIEVEVLSSESKDFTTGRLTCYVLIKFPDDTNVFEKKTEEISFAGGRVLQGKFTDIS